MCARLLQDDLENGEEVATCPSCSLIVKVIYDKVRERTPSPDRGQEVNVAEIKMLFLIPVSGAVHVRRDHRGSDRNQTAAGSVLTPFCLTRTLHLQRRFLTSSVVCGRFSSSLRNNNRNSDVSVSKFNFC